MSIKTDNFFEYPKAVIDGKQNTIQSVVKEYGTVTVGTGNYQELITSVPLGKMIIGYNVQMWSTNSAVFSILPYQANRAYVTANSGTQITNLQIRWFYI